MQECVFNRDYGWVAILRMITTKFAPARVWFKLSFYDMISNVWEIVCCKIQINYLVEFAHWHPKWLKYAKERQKRAIKIKILCIWRFKHIWNDHHLHSAKFRTRIEHTSQTHYEPTSVYTNPLSYGKKRATTECIKWKKQQNCSCIRRENKKKMKRLIVSHI